MKVWGNTDPKDLLDQHLLGEHLEIHTMLSGGWKHHPEFLRFKGQKRYLVFRHELVRVEMNRRWSGRHSRKTHPSSVSTRLLTPDLKEALVLYEAGGVRGFKKWVDELEFPPTTLSYDTPWEREGVSKTRYKREGRIRFSE